MLISMKSLLLLALLILTPTSQAAIFDAPDILPENSGAVGVFGELLLNDPTSEGAEARARYGFSDALNFGANLGIGSNGKKFRLGGETVFNILPDWDGQIGLSALASAMYLRRLNSGGLQLRVGLMGHKKIDSITGYPATIYLAIPFYLEGRSGTYTTGSQGRFYGSTELGVKLANSESYILLGAGFRLGELRFQKRSKGSSPATDSSPDEYKDEDFQ
jgi:hypothetical protein